MIYDRGMSEAIRAKVLAAFAVYSEGGKIRDAVETQGLTNMQFYAAMRAQPDLATMYHEIQESRADMMYDEAYGISTDTSIHPSAAREMAAIRMRIAQAYDRKRFGDRVGVDVAGTLDISAAIAEARNRLERPPCDLARLPDGSYGAIPPILEQSATDRQTGAPGSSPVEAAGSLEARLFEE
jgi:hypothetical protein